MDDIVLEGAQQRIGFLNRWSLALFSIAMLLISWLVVRYEAEQFGIVFKLGVACLALDATICGSLVVAAHLLIKRLEKHRHV